MKTGGWVIGVSEIRLFQRSHCNRLRQLQIEETPVIPTAIGQREGEMRN